MRTRVSKYGIVVKYRKIRPIYRDRDGNRISAAKADKLIRDAADEIFSSRGMVRGDGSFKLGRVS